MAAGTVRRLCVVFCIGFGLAATRAKAEEFALEMPIRCDVGRECFIQNYVDVDPTPGHRDYTCGRLAYDGHQGTDFRLRSLKELEQGVAVLAAAEGIVKAVRDGMPDISVREGGRAAIADRECGNGVVISHPDGWETQYCHMQRDSVQVRKGQPVKAGDALGLVGLSGATEFPHMHLSVRHQGREIDPFTGRPMPKAPDASNAACDAGRTDDTLWSESARAKLAYVPTALLGIGFVTEKPVSQRARQGEYAATTLPANADMLGFWVDIMGVQPGDRLQLEVVSPQGDVLAARESMFEKHFAQQFSFIGKRFPQGTIPPGNYLGVATLVRKGAVGAPVIREEMTVTLQ